MYPATLLGLFLLNCLSLLLYGNKAENDEASATFSELRMSPVSPERFKISPKRFYNVSCILRFIVYLKLGCTFYNTDVYETRYLHHESVLNEFKNFCG
jgi:hypothetical protein